AGRHAPARRRARPEPHLPHRPQPGRRLGTGQSCRRPTHHSCGYLVGSGHVVAAVAPRSARPMAARRRHICSKFAHRPAVAPLLSDCRRLPRPPAALRLGSASAAAAPAAACCARRPRRNRAPKRCRNAAGPQARCRAIHRARGRAPVWRPPPVARSRVAAAGPACGRAHRYLFSAARMSEVVAYLRGASKTSPHSSTKRWLSARHWMPQRYSRPALPPSCKRAASATSVGPPARST
nr:hypothetical protein [Tanacetum cinerariifolium]